MCMNREDGFPSIPFHVSERKQKPKRSKAQFHRHTRRCEEEMENDMELMNLKLYLENRSIIEENEKLRRKVNLLHQENLALMSELRKKFPHLDRLSTTLVLLHKHK